jgi:hypothetical protein
MPKLARCTGTRTLNRALGLALVLAVAALPALAGGAKKAAEKPEALPLDDGAAQKRTVADLRNAGTALFSWLTDQVDDPTSETEADASAGCGPVNPDKKEAAKLVDLVNIPEISWEELRKILVPQYLVELPRNDAWGNPFEYRLNVANVLCPQVIAIRSAGADGRFDTNGMYEVGSFEPDEMSEDLVWSDGFFVRWPQRPDPAKEPVKK